MHARAISIFAALLLVAGCSTAMKTEDIRNVQADCSNVSSQIATLEEEKTENNKRIRAGIKSIMPVTAVVGIVRGRYMNNVEIATGEWEAAIDAKLQELYTLRTSCQESTN